MTAEKLLTYSKVFAVEGTRAAVFEALTNSAHLKKWFAEHVVVEPQVGGGFRFWGKHTIWGGSEASADQRIICFNPPEGIAFSWTWNEEPTEVEIDLVERGRFTDVKITQRFTEALKHRDAESTEDFWRTAMGNLRAYLTTGAPALLPDVSGRGGDEVALSILIDASPEEVFHSLTEPAELNQWIAAAASVEPRVGGAYSYGWKSTHEGREVPCGPLKVRAIVPNRLIETDWHHAPMEGSTVRWELEPVGDQTRVTLRHVGFRRDFDRSAGARWDGRAISSA